MAVMLIRCVIPKRINNELRMLRLLFQTIMLTLKNKIII